MGFQKNLLIVVFMTMILVYSRGEAQATIYTYTTITDPNATVGTAASGINGSGAIVGSYSTNSGTYGFLDQNGLFTTISDPNATQGTIAYGINGSGDIIGSYSTNSGTYGFLDQNGLFTTITVTGNYLTQATGINDAGDIVGTYGNDSGFNGFLATPIVSATPEPSTWLLFGTGMLLLGVISRNKQKNLLHKA